MVNLDLVDWAMILAVALYVVAVVALSYSSIGGDHEAPSTRKERVTHA